LVPTKLTCSAVSQIAGMFSIAQLSFSVTEDKNQVKSPYHIQISTLTKRNTQVRAIFKSKRITENDGIMK
jgi:hypothetical protein